ncbi:MAG: HDIG domain-containing protein [Nitrospirota bacterium]|nr:HDIG domain-containing protein [Nitrospirota bacterium]
MAKERPSLQLLKRPPEGASAPGRETPIWTKILISGVSLAACLMILVPEPGGLPSLEVGDTAPIDIIAPRDLTVPDAEATRAARERAREKVPVVYDLSRAETARLEARIRDTFASIRALRLQPADSAEPAPTLSELLRTRLGILPPETLENLPPARFTRRMEAELVRILRRVLDRGVLLNREEVDGGPDTDLLIRIPGERRESYAKLRDVYDLTAARNAVVAAAEQVYPDAPAARELLAFLGQSLVFANLVENPQQTSMRREADAARVTPLYQQIRKGEVIAAAGTPILHQQAAAMQAAKRSAGPFAVAQKGIGLTVLTALIFYVFYLDLKGVRSRVLTELPRLVLTALILVGTLAICRLALFLLGAFTTGFESVDSAAIPFALPVASGAMLVTLLLNVRTALVFSMMSCILMGLMVPEVPLFTLYGFVACLVGVFTVENCQRRGHILRAGVWVGVVSALVAAGIGLQQAALSQPERLYDLGFAFCGGLLAAVVVSAVLPVLETVFNLPTNIRLLELSDLNHPLLRRLLEQAPGTYHHSMIMSNMAEQAAKAIGENALLARVGCYYHDIGKMLKPAYYIENQWGTHENLHDKLTPTMSRLVLVAHVKEGIDLARQYNLPQEIIDVIPQHHGTRLINYFYVKAKQAQQAMGAETVPPDEENFRYPGPRPQTKVAGIIMLADTVEASSRVLEDPSPARIATLVDQMVNTIYLDQQLDECELTLKDLRGIADAFGKALTGTFHHRIQYPGMQIPPTQPDAGPSEQPPTALTR